MGGFPVSTPRFLGVLPRGVRQVGCASLLILIAITMLSACGDRQTTGDPTPDPNPQVTPTETSIPTQTPIPTPTPAPTSTPTPTPTPTNTPTPTPTPEPKVALALDVDASLVGYWSDETAKVELTATLRNEGDLSFNDSLPIIVNCQPIGAEAHDCGGDLSMSLADGFGPVSETFTLRVPAGQVGIGYDRSPFYYDARINVPERILGVDRDVWECFSDTSNVGTLSEEERGIGCSAFSIPVQKWAQDIPIEVWTVGPDGFVAQFKDVLDDLSSVLGLRFRWVDNKGNADLRAYIGLTPQEVWSQGAFCGNIGPLGCANTTTDYYQVIDSEIIVYNLWHDEGQDYADFGDWHKTRFRGAMIHEAVHALGGMSHRTEYLSIMNSHLHHRAELNPMDEALLRLYSHKLIKHGRTMSTIERQIVFNNELLDPQPPDPEFASWKLLFDAYEGMREATTASFNVRYSSPGCSEASNPALYQVGNLTSNNPYFGWTRIEEGGNVVYSFQPRANQFEYWRQSRSGWAEVSPGGFSDILPGWRGNLADPHHILEATLGYADWSDIEVTTDSNGRATLRFSLDLTRTSQPSPAESVDVVIVIDEDKHKMVEYTLDWGLQASPCDQYRVEAVEGQYGVDFTFPDAVLQGSAFIDNCEPEALGSLAGYVRRYGSWTRECETDSVDEGYSRRYRFSLDDWAFVRFELASADDILISLFEDGGSGRSAVELDDARYLLGGHGVPDGLRLRWAQIPLSAGTYTVELVSRNRALLNEASDTGGADAFGGSTSGSPGFAFVAYAQPTPPPPYRFKAVSTYGGRTCGLLQDGTPLCWGKRIVEGEGGVAPSGSFVSISSGWHTCALTEDGTPVCWNFQDEGTHECRPKNDGIYCYLVPDPSPSVPGDLPASGTNVARARVGVIAGYWDMMPPQGERFTFISSAWVTACGLRQDGAAVCWGSDQDGKASPPSGESFASIDVGSLHSCGLREDGTALCWGNDIYGQTLVPQGLRFAAINAGEGYTCGLLEDGSLKCWGSSPSTCTEMLGGSFACHIDDSSPPWPETVLLASLSSGEPSCGLRDDGSAVCWSPYTTGVRQPPQGERFTSISSSGQHACAIREDGSVACWGRDRQGQASPPR